MTALPGLRRRMALAMIRVTALALAVMIGGVILFQIVMAHVLPDILSRHGDWPRRGIFCVELASDMATNYV